MGDDEDIGNAWTNSWLGITARRSTPGKMAEWFDIARWQQVPDKTEEEYLKVSTKC